ncbi:hypothetical protein TWF281_007156 [Arthrobotrys megalospora]
MSLTALSTELLLAIFEFIRFRDAYNLLTTCKLLYPIAREHLWSDLAFTDDTIGAKRPTLFTRSGRDKDEGEDEDEDNDDDEYDGRVRVVKHTIDSNREQQEANRHSLQPREWGRLIEMTKRKDVAAGWDHTKRMAIYGPTLLYRTDFAKMLTGLIESGCLKPRYVYINLCGSDCRDYGFFTSNPYDYDAHADFLLALKSYAGPDSSNISFAIRGSHRPLIILEQEGLRYFRSELLTFLDLTITLSTEGLEWRKSQISTTVEYLKTTRNLRSLSLSCRAIQGLNTMAKIYLKDISEELAEFQSAVKNLAKLRKLRIVDSAFYPGFFLTPPDGIRALYYQDYAVTRNWWLELSETPLPNLEWLKLRTREIPPGPWQPGCHDLTLESFACKSLKYFNIGKKDFSTGPRNLVTRVMESNKNLSRKCVLNLLRHEVEPAMAKCTDILKARITNFTKEFSEEYRWKWLNGSRGGEFEKILLRNFLQTFLTEIDEGKLHTGNPDADATATVASDLGDISNRDNDFNGHGRFTSSRSTSILDRDDGILDD